MGVEERTCKGMGAMQQKLKMKGKTRKGKRVWNNEDKEDKEDKEEKRIKRIKRIKGTRCGR